MKKNKIQAILISIAIIILILLLLSKCTREDGEELIEVETPIQSEQVQEPESEIESESETESEEKSENKQEKSTGNGGSVGNRVSTVIGNLRSNNPSSPSTSGKTTNNKSTDSGSNLNGNNNSSTDVVAPKPTPDPDPEPEIVISLLNDLEYTVKAMEDFDLALEYETNSDQEVVFSAKGLPDFLVMDENGQISGDPYYSDRGTHKFTLTVTTAGVSDSIEATLFVDSSYVEDAIETGDLIEVDEEDIISRMNYLTTTRSDMCSSIEEAIYPNGFTPFHTYGNNDNWKTVIGSTSDYNLPIIGNNVGQNYVYYGDHIGTKFVVSGLYLFDADSGTYFYNNEFAEQLVYLLAEDEEFFSSSPVIYTNIKNYMTSYMTKFGIDYSSVTFTTDINNPDIDMIIHTKMSDTIVNTAVEREIPIIAMYNRYWSYDPSYLRFGITLDSSGSNDVNNTEDFDSLCNTYKGYAGALETLYYGGYEFVNKSEACSVDVGYKRTCNLRVLATADGETHHQLIGNYQNTISNTLKSLDAKNQSVFETDGEIFQMAVLFARLVREDIVYPMNYLTTADDIFYRAYYADNVVSYSSQNEPQPDLGTFGGDDMETIMEMETESHTYTYTPHYHSDSETTGFYLRPGETMTITRTDNSATTTSVFMNMQRDGSSRVWDSYIRPERLRSSSVKMVQGETITISTPKGGNIYIATGANADDIDISFEITGVLSVPKLTTNDPDDIAEYVEAIQNGPFEYVELQTDYAALHVKKTKMLAGFNAYHASPEQYIEDINNYTIFENYLYAGFENDQIGTLPSGVSDYFLNLGLTEYNSSSDSWIPRRQHFNVDNKSYCGDLCSGNPIDVSITFSPLHRSVNHEMGHNLQVNRLKVYTSRSTEVSNEIFSENVSRQFAIDSGEDYYNSFTYNNAQHIWTKSNDWYNAGGDVSIDHPLWSNPGYYDDRQIRIGVYLQLIHASENEDFYTILYIINRLGGTYAADDALWAANKDKLGFSEYTRAEFNAIDGNDFMLVAGSFVGNKDMSEFFNGLGISTSDKAKEQVLANNPAETMVAGSYYVEYNNGKIQVALSTEFMPYGVGNSYFPTTTRGTAAYEAYVQSELETNSEITSEVIKEDEVEIESEIVAGEDEFTSDDDDDEIESAIDEVESSVSEITSEAIA